MSTDFGKRCGEKLVIVLVRNEFGHFFNLPQIYISSYNMFFLSPRKIMNGSLETISFTPVTQTTMAIISNVSKILALKSSPVGFHDENLMIRNFNHNTTLAAVIFNQMTPKLLSITLRFPSQLRSLQKGQTCGNFDCLWLIRNSNDLENTNSYDREGFLALQHTIFESWLKFHDKVVVDGKLPSLEFNSIQSSGDIDHSHDQGDTTTNAVWIFYYFLYFVPFLNLIWVSVKDFFLRTIRSLSYFSMKIGEIIVDFEEYRVR